MTYVSPTWVDVPPDTTPPLGAPALDAENLQPLTDAVARLDANAGNAFNIVGPQTVNYTAAANDFVLWDATLASLTQTLPTAPPNKTIIGAKIVIIGTGHTVTIVCSGSDVFNKAGGATSLTLTLVDQAYQLEYNAGIWVAIGIDLSLSQLDGRYLASPVFTGNPTAPTASPGDNDTSVATTAFVTNAVAGVAGGGGGGGTTLTPTAVKTSAYTAVPSDLVPVNTTSGAVTITLGAAPADKTQIAVKHVVQGSTNVVTVACAGSDVFNKAGGSTTLTLTLLGQGVLLQYEAAGSIWFILGDDLPLTQLDGRYVMVTNAAILDTTASDIASDVTTGTPVAGAVGKAADAGHQHQLVAHDHSTTNKGGNLAATALGVANAAGALVNDGTGVLSYVSLTAVAVNTQTASYTLVLADAGKVVEMNVASGNTLTVPPNSSVAFPIGTVIEVHQYGAGQTTLTAGAGVTIRNPSSLTTRAQYSTVALRKRATDEWVASGDLT